MVVKIGFIVVLFAVGMLADETSEQVEQIFDSLKQVLEKIKLLDAQVLQLSTQMNSINVMILSVNAAINELNGKKCPDNIGPQTSCFKRSDPSACYCLRFTESSWTEANNFCQSKGMRLVSVETEQEFEQLRKLVKDEGIKRLVGERGNWLWTSGSDRSEEGKFVWTATGIPFTHSHWWGSNQPDDAQGEDYIHMNFKDNLLWNDVADEPTSAFGEFFKSFPLCEL